MLIYNVRPQAMARLQLGYDAVSTLNPRLIYAGVFGFGQDGPYAAKPAYDDLIQGGSALGASDGDLVGDGTPRYVPNALVDRIVGTHCGRRDPARASCTASAAAAASASTFRCSRRCQLSGAMGDHMGGLTYEPPLDKGGYARHLSPDRRPYKTADGYICVIVYNDKQWDNFIKATGRDDRRTNPKFATFSGRVAEYRRGLCRIGAHDAGAHHGGMGTHLLNKADIPTLPMHDLESILTDPHCQATNFFPVVEHPTEGRIRSMAHLLDLVRYAGRARAARAAPQRAQRRGFAGSWIFGLLDRCPGEGTVSPRPRPAKGLSPWILRCRPTRN